MLTYIPEAATAGDSVRPAEDDPAGNATLALSHRIRPTGEAVVELTGDLDIATAEMAVSYATDVIKRHHGPLTIDLSALDFCDAKGLAALVRMADYAEQEDRPFQLACPSPALIKIMRITGLDGRFSTAQIPPPGQLRHRAGAARPLACLHHRHRGGVQAR